MSIMAYNHRIPMSFGQGQMGSPAFSHHNPHRNSLSPATGAEGLPAPFENQQSYPQHHQAPPQQLPLPPTTSQSPTYPQMRTAANMGLSAGPQYSLPSAHGQETAAQGQQRQYGHMAPPQPYSPGSHPGGQYGLPMASHLRPTWPQSNMPPPMMQNHQPQMQHPSQMMFTPPPGYHHGYYGQPAPLQERPFKCEQCKAAFSRNHDLKRHKRIHLSVKPFPCDFCDKTFTRKDALKRHRLVKGCEAKARARDEGGDSSISDAPPSKMGPSGDSDDTANENRTPPATP